MVLRSSMLAGYKMANWRVGSSRPAMTKSGAKAAPVALHRLQWSQAALGVDDGAWSPGEADTGPLWQMTEKGSIAPAAEAAGTAKPHSKLCRRIAKIPKSASDCRCCLRTCCPASAALTIWIKTNPVALSLWHSRS